MHRIDNSTAAAALPAATAAGPNPNGYFTAGDAGLGVPATVVDAEWLNMIQEEISAVIVGAGAALDKSVRTQLRDAINALIRNGSHNVTISGATFEASVTNGEVVYWDSANARFDEALADGSALDLAVGIANVTDGEVVCFGETPAGLMAGLTLGARYYLSGVTPGLLTTVAPADAIRIGIAKSATVMFVDIDGSASLTLASQAEMEAGTEAAERGVSPLRVKQALDVVLLGEVNAAGVATVDFHSFFDNARFNAYRIVGSNIVPATNGVTPWLRTSSDGGATYDAGASDYLTHGRFSNTTVVYALSVTQAQIPFLGTNTAGNGANESCAFVLDLMNVGAAKFTQFFLTDFGRVAAIIHSGQYSGHRASVADVDGVRFLFSSGNVAEGNFKIYGVR